jgi:hypothetical protein
MNIRLCYLVVVQESWHKVADHAISWAEKCAAPARSTAAAEEQL